MAPTRLGLIILGLGSLALLAGAYAFELLGGLQPCPLCWWQRYAHMAVIGLALLGLLAPARLKPAGFGLALAAMLAGVGIAGFHAGVEYGWWQGLAACDAVPIDFSGGNRESVLAQLQGTPLVRCDVPAWTFAGISMAGWNGLASLALAALAVAAVARPSPAQRQTGQQTI